MSNDLWLTGLLIAYLSWKRHHDSRPLLQFNLGPVSSEESARLQEKKQRVAKCKGNIQKAHLMYN